MVVALEALVIVISLKFVVSVLYTAGVSPDMAVDMADVMFDVLPKNAFAVAMTALEFPVSTPLREFSP